jgi:hypothetical protein
MRRNDLGRGRSTRELSSGFCSIPTLPVYVLDAVRRHAAGQGDERLQREQGMVGELVARMAKGRRGKASRSVAEISMSAVMQRVSSGRRLGRPASSDLDPNASPSR